MDPSTPLTSNATAPNSLYSSPKPDGSSIDDGDASGDDGRSQNHRKGKRKAWPDDSDRPGADFSSALQSSTSSSSMDINLGDSGLGGGSFLDLLQAEHVPIISQEFAGTPDDGTADEQPEGPRREGISNDRSLGRFEDEDAEPFDDSEQVMGQEDEDDGEDDEEDDDEPEGQDNRIPAEISKYMDEAAKSVAERAGGLTLSHLDILANASENDDAFMGLQDDLEGMNIMGRKKRGRKKAVKPEDARITQLMGTANRAYVLKDTATVLQALHEVIQLDPQRAEAWRLLALTYDDCGEPIKALHASFLAAHLMPKDWEFWQRLAQLSTGFQHYTDAIYCYSKAISANPRDLISWTERADIYASQNRYEKAIDGYSTVLRYEPYNMKVIQELARIYLILSDLPRAISLFEGAVEADNQGPMTPPPTAEEMEDDDEPLPFDVPPLAKPSKPEKVFRVGLDELHMLVELYLMDKSYEKALNAMKMVLPRLYGLGDEYGGDNFNEFHEAYNNEDEDKRMPLQIRGKLGACWVAVGNLDRAQGVQKNFDYLYKHEVSELLLDTYYEIVDAYIYKRSLPLALDVLSKIEKSKVGRNARTWKMIAAAKFEIGNLEDAAAWFEKVVKSDPADTDSKLQLVELYHILGEEDKAERLVGDVRVEPEGAEEAALPARSQPAPMLVDADSQILRPEKFRKPKYVKKRKQAKGGERNLTGDFEGLTFPEWFEIFSMYAKALSYEGKEEEAFEALKSASDSIVFGQIESKRRHIRLQMIAFYVKAFNIEPNDPVLNLSLGLAYLHYGMTRRAVFRQKRILQAFMFLFRYYELSKHTIDAAYNLGRAFHQLNLLDLAVEYYEKVLNAPPPQDPSMDVRKEAAYNLSLILATSGSGGPAQYILYEYCTVGDEQEEPDPGPLPELPEETVGTVEEADGDAMDEDEEEEEVLEAWEEDDDAEYDEYTPEDDQDVDYDED
ncbi:General transcription factor IIIC, polypeptide 3 [Phlyctochytrium bullatum]|nr:General transcription factor IIIC, polypeptide 3 [Phlyctochytrium bullatum]